MDLILPDYSLFIQIANFLVLMAVLNTILYRPIRKILNQRREKMATSKSIADDFGQKADRFSSELQDNMNKTRKNGLNEKEVIKSKGLEEERQMLCCGPNTGPFLRLTERITGVQERADLRSISLQNGS